MSENWLDHGHGTDPSHLPSVFSRVPSGPGGAAGLAIGSTRSGWLSVLSGPWFVAIVTAVVVFGSAGAAYAIRETLFPSLGAPTSQSVWLNPAAADHAVPAETSTTTTTSTTTSSSTTTSTTVVADEVVAVDTPAPAGTPSTVTVDDHGGDDSGQDDGPSPTASSVTAATATTVDDHGGDDPGGDSDHDDDDDDDRSGSSGRSGSGSGSGSGGGSDDSGLDD